MKYYSVNAVHENNIIEECLSINIEAENASEARNILEAYSYTVLSIDDDFEKIRVLAVA